MSYFVVPPAEDLFFFVQAAKSQTQVCCWRKQETTERRFTQPGESNR